jgi:hypothetical protein
MIMNNHEMIMYNHEMIMYIIGKSGFVMSKSGHVISSEEAESSGLVYDATKNNYKKTLYDYEIDKRNFCEENWFDWFTIPNYHLGNKYDSTTSSDGNLKSYKPCPSYAVPAYGTDPVDGDTTSLVNAKDHLNKCLPRSAYFHGKYQAGSDFCPLTRIHRLNAAMSNTNDMKAYIEGKYDPSAVTKTLADFINTSSTSAYEKMRQAENLTKFVNAHSLQTEQALKTVETIPEGEIQNIRESPTYFMQNACNTLNTADRVNEAYSVCKALKDIEANEDLSAVDKKSQQLKLYRNDENALTMMKQACNAVFCSKTNDALTFSEEGEPICFPNIGGISNLNDENLNAPVPDKEQGTFFSSMVNMTDIIFMIIATTILILFAIVVWKNRHPVIEFLSGLWPLYYTYTFDYAVVKQWKTIYTIRNGIYEEFKRIRVGAANKAK